MKFVTVLFNLLGSVYFTIPLITVVLIFVIAGTAIESSTDSHEYASLFTYNNITFLILLGCFFINILFSTLRRWPFKGHHIPFIITHIGLLMIISGVFIKTIWGLQGNMILYEGSGSETVFLPKTYELAIEKKSPYQKTLIPLDITNHANKLLKHPFPELEIKSTPISPHAQERLETWIKKDAAYIFGLPPIPIQLWKIGEAIPTPAHQVPLFTNDLTWSVVAIRTENISELIQQYYRENTQVNIQRSSSGSPFYRNTLNQFITERQFKIDLSLNFSPINGIQEPYLILETDGIKLKIALDENSTLFNQNLLTPHLGKAPLTLDLTATPTLLLLQDLQGDTYFVVLDPHGRINLTPFRQDNLTAFVAYDKGFGGYSVQHKIKTSPPRINLEETYKQNVARSIDRGITHQQNMVFPLKIFLDACEKNQANFAENLIQFLDIASKQNSWILPKNTPLTPELTKIFDHLEWNISPSDKSGCYWICKVFDQLDPLLQQGIMVTDALNQIGWPLKMENLSENEQLSCMTQQLLNIGRELTIDPQDLNDFSQPQLFSAYLRAHEICLSPFFAASSLNHDEITLECPLTITHTIFPPNIKKEDNCPLLLIELKKETIIERLTLLFDPYSETLKRPALNGEYLIKFKPQFVNIPYHLRLRQARRVNYANSDQPYSYECDLIITSLKDNSIIEKTLSMNHVHETKEGYRFYLSNIYPSDETSIKQVQLAVNYDPIKYWITYPGGAFLLIGIYLLFWRSKK